MSCFTSNSQMVNALNLLNPYKKNQLFIIQYTSHLKNNKYYRKMVLKVIMGHSKYTKILLPYDLNPSPKSPDPPKLRLFYSTNACIFFISFVAYNVGLQKLHKGLSSLPRYKRCYGFSTFILS